MSQRARGRSARLRTRRSKFNVVADRISSLSKPVIKGASPLVIFVSVPVDTPPSVFRAQGDQSVYESAACAFSTRGGRDEKVLEIANGAKAPSMGVENVIRESDGLTVSTECEERTDRLAGRKDSLP